MGVELTSRLLARLASGRPLLLLWLAGLLLTLLFVGLGLRSLHENLLAERKTLLEARVLDAYQQVVNFHRLTLNGDMTQQQAQRAALALLRQTRFGEDEYFWVLDGQGRVLMHANLAAIEGRQLRTLRGATGVELDSRIQAVLRSKGRGFFNYHWPRAGDEQPVAKVGYVIRMDPWGWGIASGLYADDITQVFWFEARNLVLILAILLAVLLIFWFGFEKALFADMRRLYRPPERDER